MIADLMGPPLLLRPWEIGRLTDAQIIDYYHHPRDEDGSISRTGCEARERTHDEARAMMEAIAKAYGLEIPDDGKQDDSATH